MDEIDLKILKTLQEDASTTNSDLADRVGLSPAPCLRRVRALEEQGVIRKYVTLLDPGAVNLGVTVFVQISLDLQVEDRLEKFERAIMRRPEVLECYLMTGDSDYLLRVVVPDVAAYERFLKESLTRIEGVAGIKSSFALKQVKYSTVLPLDRGRPEGRPATESIANRTATARAVGTAFRPSPPIATELSVADRLETVRSVVSSVDWNSLAKRHESPQQFVDFALMFEAVLRSRLCGRSDADAQQTLGAVDPKHILVGLIVTDVEGQVADQQTARALEGRAFGGSAFRQKVHHHPSPNSP